MSMVIGQKNDRVINERLSKVKRYSVCAQLCPTLFDLMDCSPPGSSVYEISQARILEWVAIPSPKDVPNPGMEPTLPALAEPQRKQKRLRYDKLVRRRRSPRRKMKDIRFPVKEG